VILASLIGGVTLLAVFVAVELLQERPMLDMGLFRSRGFVGVSIATFCLGGGMFALFPFLSIYLQDVLGYGPLGAGLRFLPLTVFVFTVPIVTRNIAQRVAVRWILAFSFGLIALALLLMHGLTAESRWTALLPGLIVAGIGIGLANPTIAAAALRVVDPTRTGMASGVNNAFRLGGLSMGVAGLGAILESRASASLAATLGPNGHSLASTVAATGARVGGGRPQLAHAATVAFVSGLNGILLVGCAAIALGAVAAGALVELQPLPAAPPQPEGATEPT
jgi:predicted MFS family arabinose efflux permease